MTPPSAQEARELAFARWRAYRLGKSDAPPEPKLGDEMTRAEAVLRRHFGAALEDG